MGRDIEMGARVPGSNSDMGTEAFTKQVYLYILLVCDLL